MVGTDYLLQEHWNEIWYDSDTLWKNFLTCWIAAHLMKFSSNKNSGRGVFKIRPPAGFSRQCLPLNKTMNLKNMRNQEILVTFFDKMSLQFFE